MCDSKYFSFIHPAIGYCKDFEHANLSCLVLLNFIDDINNKYFITFFNPNNVLYTEEELYFKFKFGDKYKFFCDIGMCIYEVKNTSKIQLVKKYFFKDIRDYELTSCNWLNIGRDKEYNTISDLKDDIFDDFTKEQQYIFSIYNAYSDWFITYRKNYFRLEEDELDNPLSFNNYINYYDKDSLYNIDVASRPNVKERNILGEKERDVNISQIFNKYINRRTITNIFYKVLFNFYKKNKEFNFDIKLYKSLVEIDNKVDIHTNIENIKKIVNLIISNEYKTKYPNGKFFIGLSTFYLLINAYNNYKKYGNLETYIEPEQKKGINRVYIKLPKEEKINANKLLTEIIELFKNSCDNDYEDKFINAIEYMIKYKNDYKSTDHYLIRYDYKIK